MRYREIRPRPLLCRYVECYWLLQDDPPAVGAPPQRILPDGCVELILNLDAPFFCEAAPGVLTRQPVHMLVGQMRQPILIGPSGRVDLLGIRFQPAGAHAVLRVPMHELTDRTFALDEVDPELERALTRRLDIGPLPSRIAAVEQVLLDRASGIDGGDRVIETAVRGVLSSPGAFKVDNFAQRFGISRRHLERGFLQKVGLSPKQFARIIRFQRVFQAVEACRQDWADLAVECGYFDQAHLIKDCRQFSGQTPQVLLTEQQPLTEIFTRKHRMSHSYNTVA